MGRNKFEFDLTVTKESLRRFFLWDPWIVKKKRKKKKQKVA